jgi:hypothetical protein
MRDKAMTPANIEAGFHATRIFHGLRISYHVHLMFSVPCLRLHFQGLTKYAELKKTDK